MCWFVQVNEKETDKIDIRKIPNDSITRKDSKKEQFGLLILVIDTEIYLERFLRLLLNQHFLYYGNTYSHNARILVLRDGVE